MQGWQDAAQHILQILSNPAWGGIGVVISTSISIIAILISRQSKISRPQRTHTSNDRQQWNSVLSNGTRVLVRNGYHRVFLAQELVKDIDVIDSTNLNRYLSQNN